MLAVRLASWAIVLMVLVLLGTDVWAVVVKGASHPVVTWGHAAMLITALVAMVGTTEEATNRFVKMLSAIRRAKDDVKD